MKVCKKCGELNECNSPICKNANCFNNTFEDYDKIKKNSLNNIKKKYMIKNRIKNIILCIFSLLLFILFLLNLFKSTLTISFFIEIVLSILFGVICIKYTSKIFFITHLFSINNINENQMSDMYDTFVKLIGLAFFVHCIIILFLNLMN